MLTEEQVIEIELYLTKWKINYIDIRFEILDHIISDVEFVMKTETLHFDDAFTKVTIKWRESLKETSGRWLGGWQRRKPKVFVEKHRKIIKSVLLKVSIYTLMFSGIFYLVTNSFNLSLNGILKNYQLILYVLLGITLLFEGWRLCRIYLIKEKTIFSYMYRTHFAFSPLYVSMFISGTLENTSYLPTSKAGQYVPVFGLIILILYSYYGFTLYRKHIQKVKQHKKALS